MLIIKDFLCMVWILDKNMLVVVLGCLSVGRGYCGMEGLVGY